MSDCVHCGARLADDAGWCGQCLARVEPGMAPGPSRRALESERFDRPVYSRWRGGPTSFGPATKIAITAFVLIMGPVGGATEFQILWTVSWAPVAVLVLWGVWRKQRVS